MVNKGIYTSRVIRFYKVSDKRVVGRGTQVVGSIPVRTYKKGLTIIFRNENLYNREHYTSAL